MVRCPVCESVQIGFRVKPRPTSCFYCGAIWLQDGSEQTAIRGGHPGPEALACRDEPDLPNVRDGRMEWARNSA
jgi:hypothetical protein